MNNAELTLEKVEKNPRIPIMTIAFGLDDKDGVGALEEMSKMTGGEHIAISLERIREIYQDEFVNKQDDQK